MNILEPPRSPKSPAFLGTPDIAVPTLEALVDAGFEVPLVITNPDRPKGRGKKMQPCAVKEVALRLGLPVSHSLLDLAETAADIAIVVAYGQIIPEELLEKLPFVNLHFSLLPKGRGAAPLERAILEGDSQTGISVMALEATLDTGPVFVQQSYDIGEEETHAELRQKLAEEGAQLIVKLMKEGFPEPRPQTGDPIYAKKITSQDRHLDWSLTASELYRIVRLGSAWTTFRGKRLLVWKACKPSETEIRPLGAGELLEAEGRLFVGTGDGGTLEILRLQSEGKNALDVKQWLNGARLEVSEKLASD